MGAEACHYCTEEMTLLWFSCAGDTAHSPGPPLQQHEGAAFRISGESITAPLAAGVEAC